MNKKMVESIVERLVGKIDEHIESSLNLIPEGISVDSFLESVSEAQLQLIAREHLANVPELGIGNDRVDINNDFFIDLPDGSVIELERVGGNGRKMGSVMYISHRNSREDDSNGTLPFDLNADTLNESLPSFSIDIASGR